MRQRGRRKRLKRRMKVQRSHKQKLDIKESIKHRSIKTSDKS